VKRVTRTAIAAILTVFAAILVSGCQATKSPVEPPQGLKVSIYQPRLDISMNQIAIKFHNDGAQPLTIKAATLTSNFFDNDFIWGPGRFATLSPGFAIDLRVDIPSVDSCDEVRPENTLRFDWSVGEVSGTSVVIPKDTYDILKSLHNNGCFIAEMNKVATMTSVSLTQPSEKQTPATLLISIAPTGEKGTLTIDSVGSSTLLRPANSAGIGSVKLDLGVVISANGPREITIPIVPNRCDAHGLAEDKVGTRIPLFVTLPDGSKGRFVLPASDQLRAEIYSFYSSFCGLG
jgi:hypothetical protein